MKNNIIKHVKKHKARYISAFFLLFFLGGVSFRQILDRHTRKRKDKIEYIVIHYTANLHPKASAEMNARYLQRVRNAGCHYAIDDDEIIQCVPENQVAFTVGDRKWLGFIPKPWLKGKVFNENSISYEMCLGGGRDDSLIVDITAQAVAWQILNKGFFRYENIPVWNSSEKKELHVVRKVADLGRIVRHHDVSGKQCPKFYFNEPWNQAKEDKAFYKFKLLVDKYVRLKLERNEIQPLSDTKTLN